MSWNCDCSVPESDLWKMLMTPDTLLILIIVSACCTLAGIIITIVRAVKFIRRRDSAEMQLWMDYQIEKICSRKPE